MNLTLLDLAIKNQIIMYQRPTYLYIDQLKDYHTTWYANDHEFCQTNSNRLILDAISLQKYFHSEFLQYDVENRWKRFQNDIAMNEINYLINLKRK